MTPWQTVTTRYTEVPRTAYRKVTCATCGKKFNRQRTFTNTVNPFNKNADGAPKTYDEVLADVRRMANEWEPEADCGKHEDES